MQMNRNTNRPTATELDAELEALQKSVLAAIAAHDGLLGGGSVESDAELRDKYADSLSRRDKIQFGWVDPDEHAIERATREGRIGGAAQENVGCVTEYQSEYVTQPTYFDLPKIPDSLRCLALGATNGYTTLPDGRGKVLHLPCGKCEHCRQWRRRLIALRYGLGKGRIQTLIRVGGFASDDYTLPVAVAESMRRRVGGKRLRLLRRDDDYLPELVLVYDCEIDDRARGLIHVDLIRKGLQGSTWVGPVTDAMVYALADSEPTRLGKRRESERRTPADHDSIARETAHFTNWQKWAEPEHDYVYADVAITTDDPDPPEPTPITSLEKTLKRLPPVERAIKAVEMRMQGQTVNRGLFDALVLAVADGDRPVATEVMGAIHQTTGPVVSRQLLTDVAGWLADPEGVRWRDCWRPVLDAVGIESPNPTCLQCGHQTLAVTPLHLCGGCNISGSA